MNKFSTWIMNNKVLIICTFIVLIALSFVGMIFVEKEGDVISYLDKDTETMIAKKLLENEFGIIGDSSISFSYLSKTQVRQIIRDIEDSRVSVGKDADGNEYTIDQIITKEVWVETFNDLNLLKRIGITDEANINQAQELANKKFVKITDAEGNVVDANYEGEKFTTYIVAFYFNTAGSDNRTVNTLKTIESIIESNIQTFIDEDGLTIADKEEVKVNDFFYIGGTSQNARSLVESSIGDMPKFFAIVVVIVLLILLLTTRSYLEPLIFLATLGISLLLNMGSNVIAGMPIGRISSITASCSTILQLAIAMDYSIFLMHTYYEEIEHVMTPKEALIRALPKTISAISASALTTVGGFIALFFMKYKMGYDLGFVLAKGVLLSLFSVIFLQPILILIFSKWVVKTQHKWKVEIRLKPVSKVMTKKWVTIVVVIVCLAICIPCAYFQTQVPLNYITMTKENPNPSFSETVSKKYDNMLIILLPYDGPETIDKHYEFTEKLGLIGKKVDSEGNILIDDNGNEIKDDKAHEVIEIFTLCSVVNKDFFNDVENASPLIKKEVYEELHNSFISNLMVKDDNGKLVFNTDPDAEHYMLYTLNLEGVSEDVESYAALDEIKALGESIFGEGSVKITGLAQGAYELSKVTPGDFALVNILSAVLIFIVLLITFRKPFLSILLMLVIETGIFANLTLVFLIGNKINFLAYLIVSAIELGATVDYAILLTSKYLDEKKQGVESMTAIKNAIYRAAPSVLTSGSILIAACLSVRIVTSNMIVGQITELIARGAFFSLILVFTFLPALLAIKDRIIRLVKIKRGKGDPEEGKLTTPIYELATSSMSANQISNEKEIYSNIAPENEATTIENTSDSTENASTNESPIEDEKIENTNIEESSNNTIENTIEEKKE